MLPGGPCSPGNTTVYGEIRSWNRTRSLAWRDSLSKRKQVNAIIELFGSTSSPSGCAPALVTLFMPPNCRRCRQIVKVDYLRVAVLTGQSRVLKPLSSGDDDIIFPSDDVVIFCQ